MQAFFPFDAGSVVKPLLKRAIGQYVYNVNDVVSKFDILDGTVELSNLALNIEVFHTHFPLRNYFIFLTFTSPQKDCITHHMDLV